MYKFILALPLALSLMGCATTTPMSPTTQAVGAGAVGGAALGNIIAKKGNKAEGTLLGAAAGAALGGIAAGVGQPKQCSYRYANGSTYLAACPQGY